jgi:hypothetical protein
MGCVGLYVSRVTPGPHPSGNRYAGWLHPDVRAASALGCKTPLLGSPAIMRPACQDHDEQYITATPPPTVTPLTATQCPPAVPPQFTNVRSAQTTPTQQTGHRIKIICYNVCAQFALMHDCFARSM